MVAAKNQIAFQAYSHILNIPNVSGIWRMYCIFSRFKCLNIHENKRPFGR